MGRRITLINSSCLGSAFIFLCGLSINIYFLTIFIFFAGWTLTGFEIASIIYVSEMGADRFRKLSLVVLMFGWACSQIFFPILYFEINSWRSCFIAIGVLQLVFTLFSSRYLDETPRYLCSKRRYGEAKEVLNKISIYNLRPKFDYNLQQEIHDCNEKIKEQNKNF